MFRLGIPLILAALLLAGCGSSSPYVLHVVTVPSGAMVYQAGGISYKAPRTLYYDSVPEFIDATTKCLRVKKITAAWASGATAVSANPLQLCGEGTRTLTLRRPSSHPGLQADLMAEQNALIRAQLKAEQDARAAAALAPAAEMLGYAIGCAIGGGCSKASYAPTSTYDRGAAQWQKDDQERQRRQIQQQKQKLKDLEYKRRFGGCDTKSCGLGLKP